MLGTDPDADRVGIGVKDNHGEWILDEWQPNGSTCFQLSLEARKEKGISEPNDMIITTIVTTGMADEIARKPECTLQGVDWFKWIAEMIREKEGKENYIVGGEESLAFMIEDKVRGKMP